MDHAWYVRDVNEMRAWRRIGAVAWSFALAALFALAYIILTSTPTLSASAWAARLGASLAVAATQLPLAALVAAMLRPSLAPLRVVGGGVDPWGVFAPPGSEARWAGARAPKNLFPAGFAASRWVAHSPPESPPDEMARDALGLAALLVAHVAAGAAACALLAAAARGGGGSCCDDAGGGDRTHHGHRHGGHDHASVIVPVFGAVSLCSLRAARYGAALGAVAAAHWVRTGARQASFAPVARPRLYRVRRAVAPACVEGGSLACVAVLVAVALAVAFPLADEPFAAGETAADLVSGTASRGWFSFAPVFALARSAARVALGACSAFLGALGHAPVGAAVAASFLASRAATEAVLTERYRFLPQSLDAGAAAACAPLLASLAARETPWAQSLAYLDLCEVCTHAHGEANAGRRDLLLEGSDANANGRGFFVGGAKTYAPAVAAALAPVLSVASAMRGALDAAERAEREAAAGSSRIGPSRDLARGSSRARGVRLRPSARARAEERETRGVDGHGAAAANAEARRGARDGSGFDGADKLVPRGGVGENRADGSAAFAAYAPEPSRRADDWSGRAFAAHASRRVGDAVASAAWAATADEWGVPSAAAPSGPNAIGSDARPPARGGDRVGTADPLPGTPNPRGFDAVLGSVSSVSAASDAARELTRGFVEDEIARGAGDSRRARARAARARSLSRQMESPCAAAAREAKAVLAAHGQLALWGARAATSLACAGAAELDADNAFAVDASRRGRDPIDASAVLRTLVAAAHAANACAAAGGASSSSTSARSFASRGRSRVPELRDARAACAALADTFRACVHAFAEAFGAEQTRRALLAEEAPGEEDAGGSAVSKADRAAGRPESPSLGDSEEETGAASRELVATLETILRAWE